MALAILVKFSVLFQILLICKTLIIKMEQTTNKEQKLAYGFTEALPVDES